MYLDKVMALLWNRHKLAYLQGGLQRLADPFRRKHVSEVLELRTSVAQAVMALGIASCNLQGELSREYSLIRSQLLEHERYTGTADRSLTWLTYVCIRSLKPQVVVETGVWQGLSSAFILSALHKNRVGELVSIDFPPLDPELQIEVGRAVPTSLRGPWRLIREPSMRALKRILPRLGGVDLFVHDSDHSFFNIKKELSIVWPFVQDGGVVIADDVHLNDAFFDFSSQARGRTFFCERSKGGALGIIMKGDHQNLYGVNPL